MRVHASMKAWLNFYSSGASSALDSANEAQRPLVSEKEAAIASGVAHDLIALDKRGVAVEVVT